MRGLHCGDGVECGGGVKCGWVIGWGVGGGGGGREVGYLISHCMCKIIDQNIRSLK